MAPTASKIVLRTQGNQCSFLKGKGTRCSTRVSRSAGLRYPHGEDLPLFCPAHLRIALSSPMFLSLRDPALIVTYKG